MKRKAITCLLLVIFSAFKISAQETGKENRNMLTPFLESSFQLGLCGESNPVAFMAGIEKTVTKHFVISYDVQFWKSGYETFCCNVYSRGNNTKVIPSVKIKYDPGKANKGFFIGVGLGYVFAKDRGTEQAYSADPVTGTKTFSSEIKQGNWDYSSFAPSFNWGVSFRVKPIVLSILNTNYFAKTPWGFSDISTGIGLRVGLITGSK